MAKPPEKIVQNQTISEPREASQPDPAPPEYAGRPLNEILPMKSLWPGRKEHALRLLEKGEASCTSCIFRGTDSAGRGDCRRYPPSRGQGERFPGLTGDMWCGEYRMRNPAP